MTRINYCNFFLLTTALTFAAKASAGEAITNQINSSKQMNKNMDSELHYVSTKMINHYNQFFKTSVKNLEQLSADNLPRIRNYYANLRQCKPGSYQYAMSISAIIVFPTSIIEGQQDNVCIVNTTYTEEADRLEEKCRFQMNDLNLFTEIEAENDAYGKISYDSSKLTPLQSVVNAACQGYLNGNKGE